MALFNKCSNCGSRLEYIAEKGVYKCLHCGSTFGKDEEKQEAQSKEPQAEQPQGEQEQQPAAEQAPEESKLKYEKESYSELSYKEVQKARLRGKMFKVEVPYLDHMLHKAEKRRPTYVVFAVFMFVLAAVSFGVMGYMAVMMLPPLFGVPLTNPEWDVFGLASSLVGLGVLLGIISALTVLAIFGVIGGYLVYNGKKALQLSTATKEEMAHGPTITRFILSSIVVVVGIIAIFIALIVIVNDKTSIMSSAFPWVLFAVVAGFIAVFIKLVRDKVIAVKWFKTLPAEEQKNYKDHVRAIKIVRHKKEMMDERNRRLFWR